MKDRFEVFDLSVLAAADRQLWISARSRLGGVYGVPCVPDREAWEVLEDASDTVSDAVRFAERNSDSAQRIGKALRDTLFGDADVLALFQRTRGAAADLARPLLIGIL